MGARALGGRVHVTAATSIVAGAAGRYATALFELAGESGSLDQAEADLATLGGAIRESADLASLISSPLYTREEQARAMRAVCQKAGIGTLVTNLVGLMADKRRLFALPEVIRLFGELMAAHRGEVTADVTAAHPLSDAQRAALADRLKASVGRDVKLNVAVDEGLIGGLVVKVGSRMIDTSIRSRLAALRTVMKEVG